MALLRAKVRVTLSDGREAVVRSATARDAKTLTALLDGAAAEADSGLMIVAGEYPVREWKCRIAAAGASPADLFLVATVDTRLVGTLNLKPDPHRNSPHVCALGVTVALSERRRGVASALLEPALAWAEGQGMTKVVLSVFPHNRAAIAFYERHGFSVEGRRRGQYRRAGALLDEVIMARFVGAAASLAAAPEPRSSAPAPSSGAPTPPSRAAAGTG